jgi:hypothetical protein
MQSSKFSEGKFADFRVPVVPPASRRRPSFAFPAPPAELTRGLNLFCFHSGAPGRPKFRK